MAYQEKRPDQERKHQFSIVRIYHQADRLAWKLYRAGGLVIGLAFVWHFVRLLAAEFKPLAQSTRHPKTPAPDTPTPKQRPRPC